MPKKRIFSGTQPTGTLHIGNLGVINNWVKLQHEYDSVFCIMDLHALTVPRDPEDLRKKTKEIASIYLAAGLDPKKSIIFVQSHVPEHSELAWLLGTITPIGELKRMVQFKEKAEEHPKGVNSGLLNYPVLMAADIVLYKTDVVPVGEDQKQHVELARFIARKFNHRFGKVLTMPRALVGARIKGLDDPAKKMSKSAESSYNYIALTDSPALIREKIKKAVTDSGKEIKYSPSKPALSNLMSIYNIFSNLSFDKIEQKYQGKSYKEFKEDLAELVVKKLTPFQKRKQELDKSPAQVRKILDQGAKKAKKIAQETLRRAKQKMGLL